MVFSKLVGCGLKLQTPDVLSGTDAGKTSRNFNLRPRSTSPEYMYIDASCESLIQYIINSCYPLV